MSRATRYLLALLGLVNVGLAVLGALLPALPTTIFLIVASWCFARSCPWLEERLFRLRLLRPYLKLVRGEEPMSPGARIVSAAMMWTAIGVSLLVLSARDALTPWIGAALIGAGLVGSIVIARFRRGPAPVRAPVACRPGDPTPTDAAGDTDPERPRGSDSRDISSG